MTNALALQPIVSSNRARLQTLLAAERDLTGSEEGRALNVEGFMEQALDHLNAGNYEGFLTCMDLAGEFAKQARDELYARQYRIKQADRTRAALKRMGDAVRAEYAEREAAQNG